MSETTTPTGGSKEMKVTETSKDLSKMFGFEVIQMDFTVDRNRIEEKDGETGGNSGTDGDNNTTPIIPGNHKAINGLMFANELQTANIMILRTTTKGKEEKSKESDKEDRENENDDRS